MRSPRLPLFVFLVAALGTGAAYGACSASFQGMSTWGGNPVVAQTDFFPTTSCDTPGTPSYHWDFGDGASSTTVAPSHFYANPNANGAFLATLTFRCRGGCQVVTSRWVCFTLGSPGCIQPDIGWN